MSVEGDQNKTNQMTMSVVGGHKTNQMTMSLVDGHKTNHTK